jgi:hypothetical protein
MALMGFGKGDGGWWLRLRAAGGLVFGCWCLWCIFIGGELYLSVFKCHGVTFSHFTREIKHN